MDVTADGAGTADQSMVRAVLADRLLTLPNAITVSRLLVLPVFIWLVVSAEEYAWACALLAVMGGSDWIDGKVARRTGQISELGKILDPAADRIVLIVAVVTIAGATDAVPAWIAWPVLVREPLMFVAVPVLAMLGASRIDVMWVGKAGTFALMSAFPWLLYGISDAPGADVIHPVAVAVGAVGVVLSWYAAARYVPQAVAAVREARRTRPPAGG